MEITKIEKAKKSLIQITLLDDTTFLLDKEFFLATSLCVGVDLSTEQIEQLKSGSDLKRAKARAIYYLSNGDLSKKALIKKLTMAGFLHQNAIAATLRMQQLGYIDDERYAKRLCEMFAAQNISLREAKHKLFEKGIEPEVINDALLNYNADPVSQIKAIISKKYSAKLTDQNAVQKVFSALVRRGFNFSDVKTALKEYIDFPED